MRYWSGLFVVAASAAWVVGCSRNQKEASSAAAGKPTRPAPVVQPSVAQPEVGLQKRYGDEIVVAGHFYRIGTPVVTWMDPGGFDAYRTERRFAPWERAGYRATTQQIAEMEASGARYRPDIRGPERFNIRYADESARFNEAAATRPALADAANWDSPTTRPLTPEQLEQVRGGGWTLDLLREKVDQFVLHYDVAGTSRNCFYVLHDDRGLSVQFMLDLDGTIYQTLDVKERAWQATKANSRSIGIEIANMGSYSGGETIAPLQAWYKQDENGRTYIQIPERLGGMKSQRTQPSVLRPARNEMVVGRIRGATQRQYDFTPQQYAALIKLTAALCDVLPNIKCEYPRDAGGKPLMRTLTDKEYNAFQGVLGHYHVQTNKSDPGVAFQWEYVMGEAKKELEARRRAAGASGK